MLALRITVVDPQPGVAYALQLGKDQHVPPTSATKTRILFDFEVEVVEPFRLRGPAVQGKPGARFVYLAVLAGARSGRVKVSLEGITPALAKKKRLEARFAGTGKNGAPAYASVMLLDEGWE